MLQQLQTLTVANQSKQLEIDSEHSEIESLAQNLSKIELNPSEIESVRAKVERLLVRNPSQQVPSHTREFDVQTQVSNVSRSIQDKIQLKQSPTKLF